jgi:diguanylate cyclase (GGDEF)-like protein/PAS domain S-box-containing protein
MIDTSDLPMYVTLLRSTLDSASDAFIIADENHRVIEWSAQAQCLFGWTADEAAGRSLCELIVPQRMRKTHEQAMAARFKKRSGERAVHYIRINAVRKDGREIPIELAIHAVELECKRFFCVVIRDGLRQFSSRSPFDTQAMLLNLSRDSIIVCDLDHRLLFWNDGARRLYGFSSEEAVGRVAHELLRSTYPEPLHKITTELHKTGYWEGEIFQQNKDGQQIAVLSRWTLDIDTYGEPARILVNNTDISDNKHYQHHIQFLATHDMLTGLPNRTLLGDRLQHAIEKASRHNGSLAILSLALNRFKAINDSLGHDKGDLLLREIGQRLTQAAGPDNTVARLGGAEFVVCLEMISDAADARAMAEHALRAIVQPARIAEHEIFVSASIGISVYPKDGADQVALLHAADVAMHQAKELGSGVFRFYSPEMNLQVLRRLRTENALHVAIERNEFMVYYQPRLCARTNELVALEALIRWHHPEKGLMLPAEFIPLAEEIGLIGDIGEWVLNSACRQNVRWQTMRLPRFRISVNLSPKQLGSSNLQQTVTKVLSDTGLDARWLEFEVTETGLMENIESAQQILTELRKLGILISIDDFGTGYSSLGHLKKLPIDALKIDKSFIADLGKDPDDAAIVTATVAMAKSMGLKVVAEGVETQEQVDFLMNLECEELQGFYFSEPLTAADLEQAIRAGRWSGRGGSHA